MSLLKTLFVILIFLFAAPFANDLLALPPGLPDAPDQAPIDGGLGLLAAGEHQATFDASTLTSGVYIVRLEAGGMSMTRRVTLLK
jgi:hypothetical protein